MKSLSRLIFYFFIFCSLTSTAQLLTVEDCFSGTKDDGYYFGFKFKETDSIRYIVIESYSENNIFDTINRNIYRPGSSIGLDHFYLLKLNENTKQTKTVYVNHILWPNVMNDEVAVSFQFSNTQLDSVVRHYAFKFNSDLDSASPLIFLDSINVRQDPVNQGYVQFYTQNGNVCNAYARFHDWGSTYEKIIQYKFDNTHLISATPIYTLRRGPEIYNKQLYIKTNKIYEYYYGLLKIYDADANELASHQLLNDNAFTAAPTYYKDLGNGEVLLIATSDSVVNVSKIKNDNTLEFSMYINRPKNYTAALFSGLSSIIDSNLLLPFSDVNDSMYFVRFDRSGNILNWYSEKYNNIVYYQTFVTLPYNDSIRIILKNKSSSSANVYVQKIDKNGVPLSSVQVNPIIFYENRILGLNPSVNFIKTKQNRYFGTAFYNDLLGGYYVIFEYNPVNNSLSLSAVLDKGIPLEIFSNNKNETYVIAEVNDGCVRKKDLVLYKLADGFNTVKGKVYIDYNNNNTQDNGEPNYENAKLNYTKNTITYSSYLLDTGIYSFVIDTGKYDITCRITDSLFTVTPATRTVSHTTYNNTDFVNFILKPIGVVYDARIVMNNTFVTRPGFDGTYAITYSNNGNCALNNYTVKLLLDNRLTPNSSNVPYIISNDTIIWNIANTLQPGEYRTININFTAQTPPTLNSADVLENIVSISIPQHDTDLTNNQYNFKDLVRGSYDPNEKSVDKEHITVADLNNNKNLLYTIRFENIGNDTAFNITIKDTLANNVKLNTLKPIAFSHPYTLNIKNNNILTFYFKNILLPPKSTNATAAHGFVSYEIQPDREFSAQNFEVKNTAHIIFDYNLPITTNTATTQIQLVSTTSNSKSLQDKIFIYPNPADEQINIQIKNIKLNNATLSLIDITGNIILSQKVTQENTTVDVHLLPSGTYILVFENEHQIQTSKFIIVR